MADIKRKVVNIEGLMGNTFELPGTSENSIYLKIFYTTEQNKNPLPLYLYLTTKFDTIKKVAILDYIIQNRIFLIKTLNQSNSLNLIFNKKEGIYNLLKRFIFPEDKKEEEIEIKESKEKDFLNLRGEIPLNRIASTLQQLIYAQSEPNDYGTSNREYFYNKFEGGYKIEDVLKEQPDFWLEKILMIAIFNNHKDIALAILETKDVTIDYIYNYYEGRISLISLARYFGRGDLLEKILKYPSKRDHLVNWIPSDDFKFESFRPAFKEDFVDEMRQKSRNWTGYYNKGFFLLPLVSLCINTKLDLETIKTTLDVLNKFNLDFSKTLNGKNVLFYCVDFGNEKVIPLLHWNKLSLEVTVNLEITEPYKKAISFNKKINIYEYAKLINEFDHKNREKRLNDQERGSRWLDCPKSTFQRIEDKTIKEYPQFKKKGLFESLWNKKRET